MLSINSISLSDGEQSLKKAEKLSDQYSKINDERETDMLLDRKIAWGLLEGRHTSNQGT